MAEHKPKLTQDLRLPAGVTVTPDHLVPEFPDPHKRRVSDRRIDVHGVPEEFGDDVLHGSTYKYADRRQPEAPVDEDRLPRESVNEANPTPERGKRG